MTARWRRRRFAALLGLLTVLALSAAAARFVPGWAGARRNSDGWFVVKPYLQLGDAPSPPSASSATLDLLWQGYDRDESWSVELQGAPGRGWAPTETPSCRRYAVRGRAPRRLYRTTLRGLAPGANHAYRVRLGGRLVFAASARAPRPPGSKHRFVAFGDGGAGTWSQRAVAYQAARERPDLVLIPGDITYFKGLVSEYDAKFFPAYNNDESSRGEGAPLMRAVPFFAAAGNHDMVFRDLDAFPDALGYFLLWAQPLNGPVLDNGSQHWPTLAGGKDRQDAFRAVAGAAYPRMANFSFDYGDVHWTVLDANPPYSDFTAPALRDWLARDLAAARGAAWRFVAFHHPPFHSNVEHDTDQRTRLLVDLLEQGGVDVVFAGHVHNYQRTYPLRFVADRDGQRGTTVTGRWRIDHHYDGVTRTRPDGIIYVVTGGGGAELYTRMKLQPFTARSVMSVHSLTVVDVEPARLTVRQVSAWGTLLDQFVVTK
jgi:hypothetical protein